MRLNYLVKWLGATKEALTRSTYLTSTVYRNDADGSSGPNVRAHYIAERDGMLSTENSDAPNAWELFMKAQNILGRRADYTQEEPLNDMESLERRARSLMILGHDLESIEVNNKIIDRYTDSTGMNFHVDRAHFNAGCAYARIGMIDRAIDQFEEVVHHRLGDDQQLVLLAQEGIRLTERLMDQSDIYRRRRRYYPTVCTAG